MPVDCCTADSLCTAEFTHNRTDGLHTRKREGIAVAWALAGGEALHRSRPDY